jgi:hypothetical protein
MRPRLTGKHCGSWPPERAQQTEAGRRRP